MGHVGLTSVYMTIGRVLCTPAALALFWLWIKMKEPEKRLNEGNSRFDRMDADVASKDLLLVGDFYNPAQSATNELQNDVGKTVCIIEDASGHKYMF